jgi:hypothetical protein
MGAGVSKQTPHDFAVSLMDPAERRTYAATVAEIVARKAALGFAAFSDEEILDHAPLMIAALLTRYANASEAACAGSPTGRAELDRLRWFADLHLQPLPALN